MYFLYIFVYYIVKMLHVLFLFMYCYTIQMLHVLFVYIWLAFNLSPWSHLHFLLTKSERSSRISFNAEFFCKILDSILMLFEGTTWFLRHKNSVSKLSGSSFGLPLSPFGRSCFLGLDKLYENKLSCHIYILCFRKSIEWQFRKKTMSFPIC